MAYFPENLDEWRKISYLIDHSEKVFITTHVNPDGDAIGSEMALAGFLAQMGKSFRIINHSGTPDAFRFLDLDDVIEMCHDDMHYTIGPRKSDMVVFLDLGRYDRIGRSKDFLVPTPAPKVIIDHHPPEQTNADVVVITPRAASTGSLLYDLMCHIDPTLINKEIAFALMTAIVTDTGYFRYSNTTATTHLIASSLYEYGVRAVDIRQHLETGYPLCRQRLMGLVLRDLKTYFNGDIVYSHITKEMFEEAGARREHTEGIIDQMRFIKNAKVAILIIQEGDDCYKVSLRSGDGVTVNAIASMLGGGGHPRAAGANLTGSLEFVISRVLDAAEAHLEGEYD